MKLKMKVLKNWTTTASWWSNPDLSIIKKTQFDKGK